jgi:hypothetical protein
MQSELEYSSSVANLIKLTQDMHKVEGTSFSQLCSWMNLDSPVAHLRPDLYFRNFYIHHYIRSGLVIKSNDHFVKEVKHFWKSIFQEILPLRVYITADISILSLSVIALFSLKSFFVYTGAAVTAVVKHE